MRLVSSLLPVAALAISLSLGTFGCGSSTETSQTAAPAPVPDPERTEAHGPSAMLKQSIGELTVRPEQRSAIDRIQGEIDAASASSKQAKLRISGALADAVRAGKLDRAAVAPLVDALVKAGEASKPAMQNVFDELHKTLDAAQRKALVASMRSRLSEPHTVHGFKKGRMEAIAKEIGLSDSQISAIKANLKDSWKKGGEEHHGARSTKHDKLEAAATAFESETFDAKSLDLGGDHEAFAGRHIEMIENVIEAALPELQPAQRSALADVIERHAQEESP